MPRTQRSKRKRQQIRKFRAVNLTNICTDCGDKIPNDSRHHLYCQKCWRRRHGLK